MFLFPLVRRPVIIAGTYDVAIVCKVDIAQCTRVRMVRSVQGYGWFVREVGLFFISLTKN